MSLRQMGWLLIAAGILLSLVLCAFPPNAERCDNPLVKYDPKWMPTCAKY